jgi:hypothetical protein
VNAFSGRYPREIFDAVGAEASDDHHQRLSRARSPRCGLLCRRAIQGDTRQLPRRQQTRVHRSTQPPREKRVRPFRQCAGFRKLRAYCLQRRLARLAGQRRILTVLVAGAPPNAAARHGILEFLHFWRINYVNHRLCHWGTFLGAGMRGAKGRINHHRLGSKAGDEYGGLKDAITFSVVGHGYRWLRGRSIRIA